jgi:hypothetical protein
MDRKAMTRAYKNTPRQAGVYRVRNKVHDKSFVGTAQDLPGVLNSQRFQLRLGSHMNRELQKDWNELGPDAFEFDVLDTLEPQDTPGYSPADDLKALEALWLDRLEPYGGKGYHTRPPARGIVPR